MINVKKLLPVIVLVIFQIHTGEQNIAFRAVIRLHQISDSSAATKLGVKFVVFFQWKIKGICSLKRMEISEPYYFIVPVI